jgi:hypothetical protein
MKLDGGFLVLRTTLQLPIFANWLFFSYFRLSHNFPRYRIYNKMKTFQIVALLLAAVVACTSAFAPPTASARTAFKVAPAAPLSMIPKEEAPVAKNNNAAAIAAFATAMAPFAAHATDIDEGTIIGYGAGLVACVVSLAVGFSIGYGTLVKP